MTECHDRRKEKREHSVSETSSKGGEVHVGAEAGCEIIYDESFICLEIYSQRLLALPYMLFV